MLVFEWYVKPCQLKKSSRSCTSFHASEGRFQNCVVFCVHKTCVNKACVKKACVKKACVKKACVKKAYVKRKSIYSRKMRAHASKWKAVHLSLHLRDCGMHVKALKKRASGNITTISYLFTWVDKNLTVEIQLKSVCASVNEKRNTCTHRIRVACLCIQFKFLAAEVKKHIYKYIYLYSAHYITFNSVSLMSVIIIEFIFSL